MTENKRFTLKEIDNFNYGIKVTDVIMDDGIELPQSTVCDLLNDLSTENDELRQELNCEKPLFTKKRLHQQNQQLTEENEQLKSTINTLTCDNTKMKKVLNTTKNENEQIKQVIKEAYETERTHIGKNTLKQLMEAIQ